MAAEDVTLTDKGRGIEDHLLIRRRYCEKCAEDSIMEYVLGCSVDDDCPAARLCLEHYIEDGVKRGAVIDRFP